MEAITPPPLPKSNEALKSKLFWPLLLALLVVCVVLGRSCLQDSGEALPIAVGEAMAEDQPFNIMISRLVEQRQRLQVLRVEFDHWEKHQVQRQIVSIRKGSLAERVTTLAPDWLKDQLIDNRFNRSEAQIITNCKVIVGFEFDFADPDQWTVRIDGDTARINAPLFAVGDVNVPPESLRGWVLEEDFIISGKKEKDMLLRNVRQKLAEDVRTRDFLNKYREPCRSSLQTFFANLFESFKEDPRTRKVRHIYVSFADEPENR